MATKSSKGSSSTKKMTLNEKLDKILENEEKILENEKKILGEEEEIRKLEEQELQKETQELEQGKDALESLKDLQKTIDESSKKAIRKITKRDFLKGFIGAFIGVMSHFAFTKAVTIATELSFFRATALYIVALVIILSMLYYTGFKNVQKNLVFNFLPLRATILYIVSIFTILFVNLLFGQIQDYSILGLYNLVAANIILAVIGAGTADLIGKMEE